MTNVRQSFTLIQSVIKDVETPITSFVGIRPNQRFIIKICITFTRVKWYGLAIWYVAVIE